MKWPRPIVSTVNEERFHSSSPFGPKRHQTFLIVSHCPLFLVVQKPFAFTLPLDATIKSASFCFSLLHLQQLPLTTMPPSLFNLFNGSDQAGQAGQSGAWEGRLRYEAFETKSHGIN